MPKRLRWASSCRRRGRLPGPEARSLHAYLSASLAPADRSYLLDDLLANVAQ